MKPLPSAGRIVSAGITSLFMDTVAIIDGITAIPSGNAIERMGANYVPSSLDTWGWIALIIGVLVMEGLGAYGKNHKTD